MITMHLFQHGWFWMIPLPDQVMSVGMVGTRSFFRTRTEDLRSFFARAVAASPSVAKRMVYAQPISPLVATGNYSYDSRHYAGDGYILIGDAAAFIDPLFSIGVGLRAGGPRGCASHGLGSFQDETLAPIRNAMGPVPKNPVVLRPSWKHLLVNSAE